MHYGIRFPADELDHITAAFKHMTESMVSKRFGHDVRIEVDMEGDSGSVTLRTVGYLTGRSGEVRQRIMEHVRELARDLDGKYPISEALLREAV